MTTFKHFSFNFLCSLILLFTIMLIQACEAPLNLHAVVSEQQKSIHRSDRFQSITDNGKVVVITGTFGILLTSTDEGMSWSRHQLETQPTLIDVTSCPDGSIAALAVEGELWLSVDNGASWQSNKITSDEVPQAITCAPNGTLWVVGSFSTFLSSADQGATWRSLSLDEDMILSYIKFFDADNGIAAGEFGMLLKTIDGGITWDMQSSMPNEFYPIAALFDDMNQGWVAGLSGKILFTSDGGQTWRTEKTHTMVPLYGLSRNETKIIAVGALGTLLVKPLSGNDDAQWQSINNQNIRSYLRASLPTKDNVIIAGGGTVATVPYSEGGASQ